MENTGINTIQESLKNRINSLTDDLRAEVIISELIFKIKEEDRNFLVDYQGQFKRPFRKDVLGAEIVDFNFDSTQFVKINLSRDGIFDTLPEGLFHATEKNRQKISVDDMTKEYKTHKKEEEYARKFFLPFENEFFLKSIERETKEKEILLELNGSKPIDFFYDFWDLDRSLPEILMSKLLRILPYTNQIVGNLELTIHCLSYLIEEKVDIAERTYKEQSSTEQEITLGDCRLGLDMISGSVYMDYSLYLEFRIGELKKTSFQEYIHEGKMKKFLELFYEYFLPMEVDVKTTILLDAEEEQFDFNKTTVLGITTRI